MLGVLFLLVVLTLASAQDMETVTGTIFSNNEFVLYVNGEQIADDPIRTIPHNAVNVTFSVLRGEEYVIAIEAIDLADEMTGLESENRCVGGGGLRAMFSNGVVTNRSWVCSSVHYGPTNWRDCFAAQMVRNQSQQLVPECLMESTPPLEGCVSRVIPKPEGWTDLDFDDSRWEYALEYEEEIAGYGLPPPNCTTSGTIISGEPDDNGDPVTCPQNLDWGEARFIWRSDLALDNTILCRYTVNSSAATVSISAGLGLLVTAIAFIMQTANSII